MLPRAFFLLLFAGMFAVLSPTLAAEDAVNDGETPKRSIPFGEHLPLQSLEELLPATDPLPVPTVGGILLWGDVRFFHGWHIQKNVYTGTYRLLDENAVRFAEGSLEICEERLAEIRKERNLPPMSGRGLILLHGFASGPHRMKPLVEWMRKNGDYSEIFNVVYPSTRQSIDDHARMLRRIVENLEGIERIDFVGHSLGSIVIRRYLGGPLEESNATEKETEENAMPGLSTNAGALSKNTAEDRSFLPDARIGRFVMIGPPNNGSETAVKLFKLGGIARWIGGRSGQELGPDWAEFERTLGIPGCPFGIIAGTVGSERGNPLISGENDRVVSVAGTRLEGADDYLLLPLTHVGLLREKQVFEAVRQFLDKGRFTAPAVKVYVGTTNGSPGIAMFDTAQQSTFFAPPE